MIAERFSGRFKIIEADTVYLFEPDSSLVLSFMFKDMDFDLKISHEFWENGEVRRLTVNSLNGDIVINPAKSDYNSRIGTLEPIEIAEAGEKKLYMHVWSYPVAELVRKIEYTVYAGD